MKSKKINKYLTVFTVILMLMTFTAAVNAVSVKLNDENEMMQTMDENKEIKKYGWTERLRSNDGWEQANPYDMYLPSESGQGARCNKYYCPTGQWKIFYKFELSEWEDTHSISDLQIGVNFAASTVYWCHGPDLYVSDQDGTYTLVKQSMGTQGCSWQWHSKDNNGAELSDYVNSNGEIYIYVLNPAGCHTMVEQVGVKWTIDNYYPSASISGPSTVDRGVEATYTSSASDPDGDEITEYKWKVDGSEKSTSEDFTYAFTTSGEHTVSLKVKDEHGAWSDTASKTVTVNENLNPTMSSISPNSGKVRTDVTFTFTAGDINNDKVKFKIEWGDGDTQTTSFFDSSNGQISGTVTHEYELQDDYTISAKAIDEYDGESDWMTTSFSAPRSRNSILLSIQNLIEQNYPILTTLLNNFI